MHEHSHSYTLIHSLAWNFPLLIISYHMSPFCRSPAALLPARQQSIWGVHLWWFQIKQHNPAVENLSTWFRSGLKPVLRVMLCSKKEPVGGKKAEDRLMNTYAIVIKLFWLHCVLHWTLFPPIVSVIFFFFVPHSLTDRHAHTFICLKDRTDWQAGGQ